MSKRMHLQWFAEEAAPEEEMTFEAGENPDDGVEVIIDTGEVGKEAPPADMPKTKEELLALINQAGEGGRKESSSDLLTKQFEKLNDNLARVGAPQVVQQNSDPDPDVFVKENIFEKPKEALDYYFAKKLQPDVQRIILNNVTSSRRFATLDPELKETMTKYGKEVDEVVQNMDMLTKLQNPDPYSLAVEEVKKRHINDIIKDQAVVLAKQMIEEMGKTATPPSHKTFNETPKRPQPPKTVLRMTREQENEERAEAAGRGVEWADWIRTTSFKKKYGN